MESMALRNKVYFRVDEGLWEYLICKKTYDYVYLKVLSYCIPLLDEIDEFGDHASS
jgi:hypothetical protein